MRREPVISNLRRIERGRRFEPVPVNVRAAREFVRDALDELGYGGDADTVLLLVSELVTNAVRHAATPFEITVDAKAGGLRVAVADGDGAHPPRVLQPTVDDTNGRGLYLVDRLSEQWGSDPAGEQGKTVWFTVA